MEGDFDTILELFTAGGAMSHLSVTAAVVAPSLALTPILLDLGVTHLGVPQQRSLTLSNLTMLPTSFSWEAYGSDGIAGEIGGGQMEVTLDPPQGVIEPGKLLHWKSWITATCNTAPALWPDLTVFKRVRKPSVKELVTLLLESGANHSIDKPILCAAAASSPPAVFFIQRAWQSSTCPLDE